MYPYLTEDSEIFFEVGSDGALFEKYDGQTVIFGMTDEGLNLMRKSWGGAGNVIPFLIITPTSQKQNINIHQSN